MSVSEAKRVLAIEAEGLQAVHDQLGPEFEEAIDLKMIDRLANMREASKNKNIKLLKMYVDEIDDYDSLFTKGNKDIYNEIKLFRYDILLVKTKKCKM